MSLLQNKFYGFCVADLFDYQSECHCPKTDSYCIHQSKEFDYQSECHCSKTRLCISGPVAGLTTSQNVTAPKRAYQLVTGIDGLTTSQNVTAPKPLVVVDGAHEV